jgi:hypothetical protein
MDVSPTSCPTLPFSSSYHVIIPQLTTTTATASNLITTLTRHESVGILLIYAMLLNLICLFFFEKKNP